MRSTAAKTTIIAIVHQSRNPKTQLLDKIIPGNLWSRVERPVNETTRSG